MSIGAEKRRDEKEMENHYYNCMYDILKTQPARQDRLADLNRFKAKIIKIYSDRMRGAKRRTEGAEVWSEERLSIHHIIRLKKRQEKRTITTLRTAEGNLLQSSKDILLAVWEEMRSKYRAITVEKEMMRELLSVDHNRLSDLDRRLLDEPLKADEIERATRKGGDNKAPGPDGIGKALFTRMWNVLQNEWKELFVTMFEKKSMTDQQKQGVMVCIPKIKNPTTTGDYRNITLLNSDYKIMARILAARLQAVIGERLHPDQHCGAANRSIFDAAATLRDVIAHTEVTGTPVCVLSLDLAEAFDRIAHEYLYAVLTEYGCSGDFVDRVRSLYSNATSRIQVNGHMSPSFPIECSVRQGCPLSMLLFAVCVDPLLHRLEQHLCGIRIRRGSRKIAVIAYADDITVLLTSPEEIDTVMTIIQQYERATGAKLNLGKSKALATGAWAPAANRYNIQYREQIQVLGFPLTKETNRMHRLSWEQTVRKISIQAKDAYHRDLSLPHRIQYVHMYLLARLWYTAHIFPPWKSVMQQLLAAVACYIWKGSIFRTPLSTLQRERTDGGWGLVDVEAKCRVIFTTRMLNQMNGKDLATAEWIRSWGRDNGTENPPRQPTIPNKLEYLCAFIRDLPYIKTISPKETVRAYRKRLYTAMILLYREGREPPLMRIVQQEPNKNWNRIWTNLHDPEVGDDLTASWYAVIQDLLPTKVRLHKINLAGTTLCTECGLTDSRLHQVIECGERERIWVWTRQRIAWILRTIPSNIPTDWILWPQFAFWPRTRNRAVAWLLTHLVHYCRQGKRRLTLSDYCDFLRRARWKEERKEKYTDKLARYLTVLDPPPNEQRQAGGAGRCSSMKRVINTALCV